MSEDSTADGLRNKRGRVAVVTKAWLLGVSPSATTGVAIQPDATTYGAKKMQRMVFIVLVEFALFVIVWSFGWLWPLEKLCAQTNEQTRQETNKKSAACVFLLANGTGRSSKDRRIGCYGCFCRQTKFNLVAFPISPKLSCTLEGRNTHTLQERIPFRSSHGCVR